MTGGTFAPGEKITIPSVAKALGVSSTPAREALNILAAEGVLDSATNRSMIAPPLSLDRLAEITRVPIALECLAAEITVERAKTAEIQAIVAANARLKRATLVEDF